MQEFLLISRSHLIIKLSVGQTARLGWQKQNILLIVNVFKNSYKNMTVSVSGWRESSMFVFWEEISSPQQGLLQLSPVVAPLTLRGEGVLLGPARPGDGALVGGGLAGGAAASV